MKKMAMLLVAGCTIGMLTGCGIPEEDHNAIVDGINEQNQEEVDKLNGTIADRDDVIKSEKAKARENRIKLDDSAERINSLQQKSAEIKKSLATEKSKAASLESELKTATSQAAAAQDDAQEAENKYNTLDVEYQELKRRFEMFQKNMSGLNAQGTSAAAPAAAPAASTSTDGAPASDAQKASSLLDQMGTM